MRFVLGLVFIIIAFSVQAQSRVDSILAIWNNGNVHDTIRLKTLNPALRAVMEASPSPELLPVFDSFIVLASKYNLPLYEANGLLARGQLMAFMNGFDKESRPDFEKALEIYKTLEFTFGISRSLSNIGNTYRYDDPVKAVNLMQEALDISLAGNELKGAIGCAFNLSTRYLELGERVKALEKITQAVQWAEELGDKTFMAMAYHGLSHVYIAQGKLDKGNEFHDKVYKLYVELNNDGGALSMLGHIGESYQSQNNYVKALDYYKQSLKMAENNKTPVFMSSGHGNLAKCYLKLDSLEKAKFHLDKCLEIVESSSLKNEDLLTYIYIWKGELKIKEGLYAEAVSHCILAKNMAAEHGLLQNESFACNCLFEAYRKLDKGNDALEIQDRITEIEAIFKADEVALEIQQLAFAKAHKADSIARRKEEIAVEAAHKSEVEKKERTRNIAIVIGALILLIAGGLVSRLRYVRKSKAIIESERDRSDNLLLNILPADIAKELKEKGKADARDFDLVSILFTDFKEFTQAAEKLTAAELVNEINTCFEAFDAICEKHKVEKIKTIGDSYMAAGGLPVPNKDSVKNTVLAALEMQEFIITRGLELKTKGLRSFQMRAGVHTGPVVAGIVGIKKFQYDIWGDTVNTASRMESHGEVGKVNISEATYELLKDDTDFEFENRGKIEAKGKGEMEMIFVSLKEKV